MSIVSMLPKRSDIRIIHGSSQPQKQTWFVSIYLYLPFSFLCFLHTPNINSRVVDFGTFSLFTFDGKKSPCLCTLFGISLENAIYRNCIFIYVLYWALVISLHPNHVICEWGSYNVMPIMATQVAHLNSFMYWILSHKSSLFIYRPIHFLSPFSSHVIWVWGERKNDRDRRSRKRMGRGILLIPLGYNSCISYGWSTLMNSLIFFRSLLPVAPVAKKESTPSR